MTAGKSSYSDLRLR